jgi:hypothetical protein
MLMIAKHTEARNIVVGSSDSYGNDTITHIQRRSCDCSLGARSYSHPLNNSLCTKFPCYYQHSR